MKSGEERYQAYLDDIFNLKAKFGYHRKPGYLSVEEKLRRLDVCRHYLNSLTPGWDKLKLLHVAGSCGKGTTALFLSGILHTRYKVGTLLSPHIFDVTERILINLDEVSRSELMEFWETELRLAIRTKAGDESFVLSLPEIMLVTAVQLFLQKGVDLVVLETGLGGRYDQTNIFSPLASLITTVSLDHTHILGETVEEIAYEKGGIIKPGVPFYTTEEKDEVLAVFKALCREQEAPFHQLSPASLCFKLRLPEETDTHYNRMNAALAAACLVDVLGFDEEEIGRGLARVRLKARFEQRGNTVIDIAHNQAELEALALALEEKFPNRKKLLVMGLADKKRHREMLATLAGMARAGSLKGLFFGQAGYRGMRAETLAELAATIPGLEKLPTTALPSGREAYEAALEQADQEEGTLVVVTGSTFFVDAVFNPWQYVKDVNMGSEYRKAKDP